MQKISVQKMVQIALLVALEIVLSRFLSFNTSILKIGFKFVPVVLAAMLYGPVWGATVAGLGDLLGALLFPIGPYFPGFTLTAVLIGLVYGLFLYREVNLRRIVAAASIACIPLGLGLNSLWICILYEKGIWAILPGRIFQEVGMLVIQILVIWLVLPRLMNSLRVKMA